MAGWVRPLSVLGGGFGGVVLITVGLAGLIVPEPVAPSTAGPSPALGGENDRGLDPNPGVPGLGGTIAVSGDREGSFALTRDTFENGYALVGGAGRITFEGSPAEVVQVSYDGLEFFPDEGQCSLTAGNLEKAIGIGFAELHCEDLVDIRDNGMISLAGEIGLPLDRLVARQLPVTGGTASVGGESWTFEEAWLLTWQQPAIAGVGEYNLVLEDLGGPPRRLNFMYDVETHALSLATVVYGNAEAAVPGGACSFDREELGLHNPRTVVVDLAFTCPSVEVPGMGSVAIDGRVVVDELQWPE
jgi:hypothetical protein